MSYFKMSMIAAALIFQGTQAMDSRNSRPQRPARASTMAARKAHQESKKRKQAGMFTSEQQEKPVPKKRAKIAEEPAKKATKPKTAQTALTRGMEKLKANTDPFADRDKACKKRDKDWHDQYCIFYGPDKHNMTYNPKTVTFKNFVEGFKAMQLKEVKNAPLDLPCLNAPGDVIFGFHEDNLESDRSYPNQFPDYEFPAHQKLARGYSHSEDREREISDARRKYMKTVMVEGTNKNRLWHQ
jgi:hypothetical protein